MMKGIEVWISVFICLFIFTGCGQKPVPTENYVPVAEYMEIPASTHKGEIRSRDYFYGDNEIICRESIWFYPVADEEDGHLESVLWAVPAGGEGDPRVICRDSLSNQDGTRNRHVRKFTMDIAGNLYLYEYELYYDPDGIYSIDYYLRKLDAEGRDVYRTMLPDETYAQYVCVDNEGNVALLLADKVLFFDSQGEYRGETKVPWGVGRGAMPHITNSMIRVDGQGYFLWEKASGENAFLLWETDFQKGCIAEEAISIDLDELGIKSSSAMDCVLLEGGELGLLISTKDVLWKYSLASGTAEEVIRWDSPNIDLDGRGVAQVKYRESGNEGISLEVLLYDEINSYIYDGPMTADITYIDSAYLPQRQVIHIGLGNSFGDIEDLIRRFNRRSDEYRAVAVQYSPETLRELLMYGKDVPDVMDVTGIRTQWLESKGLLEDLAPYFGQSGKVAREDILPAVWNLMEKDGKIPNMAASFTLRSLSTAVDVPENGWTYGQYLEMGAKYPDSWYFQRYDAVQVWGIIIATVQDQFIDWEAKRCWFDCDEFKELLEQTAGLNYPPHRKVRAGTAEQLQEDVEAGRILFRIDDYGSPSDYNRMRTECNDVLKNIGYPTANGEPMFLFTPSQSLAIYGESHCKDGAWAFLEFLLSEDMQDWYSAENNVFPVRKEAFEMYFAKRIAPGKRSGDVREFEDTPAKLRYMAEHMGISQNVGDEITTILLEEAQACVAGDKTAAETAKVIQNRIQLYLDEIMD